MSGRIYAQATGLIKADDRVVLNRASQIPAGPYRVTLMPRPDEYYKDNTRITRELDVWALGSHRHSETPYGTYERRRREALIDATEREDGIFSEMAKMALGQWSTVEPEAVLEAIKTIGSGAAATARLLGLLGLLYRFADEPSFPTSLQAPIEACVLAFDYGLTDTHRDATVHTTERHEILTCACEILAGQRFPERVFDYSGEAGRWHRERGEQRAVRWLRARGTQGFAEWDSNSAFASNAVALSHLIDFAESEPVWELASVVMDKMVFALALNSYRGVFGSTHGCSTAAQVKGGLLEATSGISRLLWGMGIFNHHIEGPVSLSCLQSYTLPSIISNIARAAPDAQWGKERHTWVFSEDQGVEQREVNKVSFKTPDIMLSSAQDYYPGTHGMQEHIWQATLGPEAVVFVTHPLCVSESNAHRPNFWLGNGVLPRVAQWKDTLISIHNLPQDDWMGFTHAYFPTHAFDEYALQEGLQGASWAFARKGNGYVALAARQGLSLVTQGRYAYRELRSYGSRNVWLCYVGRAAQDGDFGAFQDKVVALDIAFEELSVRCTTLRHETLSFGWEGPFMRNGREQPLHGFKHYETPYCNVELPADTMDIRFGSQGVRLKFGEM
jgi:hypothetical protein